MPAALQLVAPTCSAPQPAAPKRQRLAGALAAPHRQQPTDAASARRGGLAAARAASGGGRRAALAASRDAGDEFEEMMERREELLRIKGDLDGDGLNTDDDEELADITDRLLKFGYLEDTGLEEDEEEDEEEAAGSGSETELSDEDEEEGEEAEALYLEEGEGDAAVDVLAGAEDEEAAQRSRGGRPRRGEVPDSVTIDAIVSQVQQGGTQDLRTMGLFESDSPGAGAAGTAGEEGEVALEDKYPQPPQRRYRLADLLRMAGYAEQAEGAPDVEIAGLLTCNSLSEEAESLYVCVPSSDGEHDGHDWADEAVEKGAVAVLAERELPDALLPVVVVPDLLRALSRLADAFYERPSRRMRTVGVVGCFGKTTTAWLARGMFEEMNERCGMIGTIEYALAEDRLTEDGQLWVPDEEDVTLQRDCSSPFHITPYKGKYPAVPSTPDALHMHKVLAGCADRGAAAALVELEPASLADGRAADVDLDVLVYTNTLPDGVEAAGGEEAYRAALLPLFDRLRDVERQRAVISIDDPLGAELAERAMSAGCTVLTYSLDNREADVYAEKVKTSIWETEVLVTTPLGRLQIITPMLGRQAAANALAAVSAGIACGVPLKAIVAGIEAVDIIPGRSEVIDEGQQFSVMVDSASTPGQLSRLLDEAKDAGAKRVLLVYGCPGTTTPQHRAAMTQVAHFKADTIYLTNDSPGVEFPDAIIADMVGGLPEEVSTRWSSGSGYTWLQDPHRVPQWYQKFMLQYQSSAGVYIVEDRFQAIRVAIGMAKPREVVIVAGKGHQDWQEYWDGEDLDEPETVKSWFDDRVECRNALCKLPYLNGIKDLNRDFLPWSRYPIEDRFILEAGGEQLDGRADAL